MKTFYLCTFLLLLLCHSSVAQEKTLTQRKKSKLSAKEQIGILKNGALLVRLKTRQQNIEALRRTGSDALAAKIEKRQARTNLKIVSVFIRFFDFCPMYFFHSNYTEQVKEGKLDEVVFLNIVTRDSFLSPSSPDKTKKIRDYILLPDSSIKPASSDFLIAEFGQVEPDTFGFPDQYTVDFDTDGHRKSYTTYYVGRAYAFYGLLIRDDQFIQLGHPFPFNVKPWDILNERASIKVAVRTMNRNLAWFYKRCYG